MVRPSAPAVVLAALALGACGARRAPEPAPPGLAEVRAVERDLGYQETPNFHQTSHSKTFELCYLAGRLELPDDYERLELRRVGEKACRRLGERRDAFYYAPEALAGVEAPVTESLGQATAERRDFVVAHEDFHEQPGVRELPPAYKEAVSTLVGMAAAAETARRRGEEPLDESRIYLEKARLINDYHARLKKLFAAPAGPREMLTRKAELYRELEQACSAIEPSPRTFNPCPGALNNAGLAFDHTYTRAYPDVYEIYLETGDPATLTERVREVVGTQ